MAGIGDCFPVDAVDPAAVADLADRVKPDLVVVGADDPLVAGVVDAVTAHGYLAFGPNAAAARLEGSKKWMKGVLASAGVPTAAYRTFESDDEDAAFAFLDSLTAPYVVKTDGLAAGKGVLVTESLADARAAVRSYLSGAAFGDAGRTCVIEEGLARARTFALRALRRPRRVPDRARAGSQACVRRRHRPEHGRDGCVLAGSGIGRRRPTSSTR